MIIQNEKKIKGFLCFFCTNNCFRHLPQKMAVCLDSRQPNKQSFCSLVTAATATVVRRTVTAVISATATRSVVAEEGNENNSNDDQPKSGIIE